MLFNLHRGPGRPERRDLNLYWWGQTASAFGAVFTSIAVPVVAVLHLNASPGQIALISAASTLPVLLLGLPMGMLADRVTRPRRTLLTLDTVSAAAVGLMALGLAHGSIRIWWLIMFSLVQGCVSLVVEIVYFIHLRQLCEQGEIGRQRARLQAGEFVAGFIGRLLVGPTIVVFGGAVALLIDAASYLLSAAALLSMRRAALAPRTSAAAARITLTAMGAGARFLLGRPFHRGLSVFIMVGAATGAAAGTLTAPFLLRTVHVPTSAYGLVFAMIGLMGLAGSTAAGRIVRPGRDPRRLALTAFTAGIGCALLLPLSSGPLAVAMACAALGLGLPIFFGAIANVALSPVIVADVPEEEIGRAMATLRVVAGTAGLVGALLGGLLGDRYGVREALWIVNVVGFGSILLVLPNALRAARNLNAAPAPTPPAAADEVVTV